MTRPLARLDAYGTDDQVCCGSPRRDHVDVPLRYIVWCRIKHWLYRR